MRRRLLDAANSSDTLLDFDGVEREGGRRMVMAAVASCELVIADAVRRVRSRKGGACFLAKPNPIISTADKLFDCQHAVYHILGGIYAT